MLTSTIKERSKDSKMTAKEKPCLILCGQNQLVRLDEAQPDSFVIASLYFLSCVALEIRKGKSLTFAHIDSSTDLNFILEEIKHLKSKGDADQPITIDVRCIEGVGDENARKINKFLKNNTATRELLSRDTGKECWKCVGAFYATEDSKTDAVFVSINEDTSHGESSQVETCIKKNIFDCLHPKENGDKVYGGDLKIFGIPAKGLLYSQIFIKYWSVITNLEEIILLEGKTNGTRPILPIFDGGKYLPEFIYPKLSKKAVDVIKVLFPGEISDDNPNIFFENQKNRVRFSIEVAKRNENVNTKLLVAIRDDMAWARVFPAVEDSFVEERNKKDIPPPLVAVLSGRAKSDNPSKDTLRKPDRSPLQQ